MLIKKGNICRNVSVQEAEKFKQQGYKEVEIKETPVKRGGKNGEGKT